MRVIEIASRCNPESVAAELLESYQIENPSTPDRVVKWRELLLKSVLVDEAAGMVVVVSKQRVQPSNQAYYDVSGRDPDGTKWALDLTGWGTWAALEVINESDLNLTLDQLAAHLFWEMTFHGWPSQAEEFRDNLLDTIEAIKRQLGDNN